MWINDEIAPLRIVNTYGLFAVMTTARPEIIVEGSDDGVHWREYTFKYKPGDVKRPPLWNIPHQPRLDWQMWFAALGTPSQNPWFLRFLQRLLENSPEVTALLGSNPFAFLANRLFTCEPYFTTIAIPAVKKKKDTARGGCGSRREFTIPRWLSGRDLSAEPIGKTSYGSLIARMNLKALVC